MTDKMTRDEVLAVLDGMIWACKAERETWDDDGTGRYDEIRKQAEVKEAATRTAVSALYDEVEALLEIREAAGESIEQTKANQRDGLVPTIYYPAHQRLISALARAKGGA